MFDTTPITIEITKLIAAGVPEGEIVTRVLQQFPHLTVAELSTALQVATSAAERQAIRRHWWDLWKRLPKRKRRAEGARHGMPS